MERITVDILNWEKYNKRKDVKAPWWMAISNRIAEDPDLFCLTHAEFKAWVYILCLSSQKRTSSVTIDLNYVERCTQVKKTDMMVALKKLKSLSMISYTSIKSVRIPYGSRTDGERNPTATLQDNTIQDRTRHNTTAHERIAYAPVEFDFASVGKLYPNARGRSEGVTRLKKLITSPDDFEKFRKAVVNYSAQVKLDGTEMRFIKHFSSFVGSEKSGHPWHDWVDHVPARSVHGGAPAIESQRTNDLDAQIFGSF